jgi:hypothetical protein
MFYSTGFEMFMSLPNTLSFRVDLKSDAGLLRVRRRPRPSSSS